MQPHPPFFPKAPPIFFSGFDLKTLKIGHFLGEEILRLNLLKGGTAEVDSRSQTLNLLSFP
jgi:hypothetical protein